ncbi:NADP-dependent oxidoreductase [Streptomyces sp. NPDC059568]|uniref:NADP-dependent oxidoreductase n=1 Tax=Streptomyces sp. NPDC059568 TaxID=3346868 RepID=UPI00369016C9
MRAVVVRTTGGPEVVEVIDRPVPEPGIAEVRIKVRAASLNPADAAVRAGFFGAPPAGGVGLGWDVAGVVDAVGPAVALPVGAPVIALVQGTLLPVKGQAEYVVVGVSAVAPAPAGIAPELAATIPLNGLTAAQSLELLGLEAGATVLITGAAGAVGGYAVQLAGRLGLTVIATGSAADEALVRDDFGAQVYLAKGGGLGAAVREHVPDGVDGVLDTAMLGGAALPALRDGGVFVTTRIDAMPRPERGIRVRLTSVGADASRLTTLSDLAASGRITPRVAATYPLEEAATAHARLAAGGLRGRVVLVS